MGLRHSDKRASDGFVVADVFAADLPNHLLSHTLPHSETAGMFLHSGTAAKTHGVSHGTHRYGIHGGVCDSKATNERELVLMRLCIFICVKLLTFIGVM